MDSRRRGLLVSSALALGVLACVVHVAAQGCLRDLQGHVDVLDVLPHNGGERNGAQPRCDMIGCVGVRLGSVPLTSDALKPLLA